jgi:hypothetical protein
MSKTKRSAQVMVGITVDGEFQSYGLRPCPGSNRTHEVRRWELVKHGSETVYVLRGRPRLLTAP